jgi:hypothetical protein
MCLHSMLAMNASSFERIEGSTLARHISPHTYTQSMYIHDKHIMTHSYTDTYIHT